MKHVAARVEILSAAIKAIAASLPQNVRAKASAALIASAIELDRVTDSADADAALAGELAELLAALSGEARVQPCTSFLPRSQQPS